MIKNLEKLIGKTFDCWLWESGRMTHYKEKIIATEEKEECVKLVFDGDGVNWELLFNKGTINNLVEYGNDSIIKNADTVLLTRIY